MYALYSSQLHIKSAFPSSPCSGMIRHHLLASSSLAVLFSEVSARPRPSLRGQAHFDVAGLEARRAAGLSLLGKIRSSGLACAAIRCNLKLHRGDLLQRLRAAGVTGTNAEEKKILRCRRLGKTLGRDGKSRPLMSSWPQVNRAIEAPHLYQRASGS